MPLSSTSRRILSAWLSKLFSFSVLRRMLSWVVTRLVSWLDAPPPPEEETGEPTVEAESDGECLTSRDVPPPPPRPLAPPCESDDKLASEEARRGLPELVTARERCPV